MDIKELTSLDPEDVERIHEALDAGRKIEAIKILREASGVDLKTAKETVEMVERLRPRGGATDGSAGHAAVSKSSGCGSVLLLGAVGSLWWMASILSGG